MPSIAPVAFKEMMIPAKEGISLRLRNVEMPEHEVVAEVVLTHGLGEHCRRYEHVAGALAAKGFRLWAYDLRGHGRSGGRRGDATGYELLLDDLDLVFQRATREGRASFLFGHSFGGQITLRYLQERQPEVRGAVICSPWLRLAFTPPWWRLALARFALGVCPGWTQKTSAVPAHLSRDLEHLLGLPDLELTHHRISPRLYFAIEAAASRALAGASSLDVPLLLIHGADDPVTCARATKEFYERVGSVDKTFEIYPDARHETHNDLCRDQVLSDICNWIGARV